MAGAIVKSDAGARLQGRLQAPRGPAGDVGGIDTMKFRQHMDDGAGLAMTAPTQDYRFVGEFHAGL